MYNRARAKLAGDERAALEATLKELQKLLTLEDEEGSAKSAPGKKDDEEEGEREAEVRQCLKLSCVCLREPCLSNLLKFPLPSSMVFILDRPNDAEEGIERLTPGSMLVSRWSV